MKKLITLVVAGCMVLGSLGTAAAIDVKVSGQWWFHYGYYSNNALVDKDESGFHQDRLRARQRVRTQVEFIASENLSAMLNLEANMQFGKDASNDKGVGNNTAGGALDSDQTDFVIKRAYLDWTIPNTQVKTRMGMQGIALPYVAFGNPILNADVMGVSVNTQFTPELGLTAFWARPYDGGYTSGQSDGKNSYDDMDMFGVMLPIKTSAVRLTPWGMLALAGKDSGFYKNNDGTYKTNRNYRGFNGLNTSKFDSQTWGWWAGTTFELPIIDPFFVKLDAMMGGLETGDSDYDTFGYLIAADIGYKFSFGALSAIGWYSSGDKDKDDLGTMPIVSDDTGLNVSRMATAGSVSRSYDRLVTGNGLGMWGIGLKLADVSFVDKLKHTVIGLYMGGTNKGDSWDNNRSLRGAVGKEDRFGKEYLMSSDRAWEIDLLNEYKVSDNLTFNVDFAYVWLDLGKQWDRDETTGSFGTMIGVTYQF